VKTAASPATSSNQSSVVPSIRESGSPEESAVANGALSDGNRRATPLFRRVIRVIDRRSAGDHVRHSTFWMTIDQALPHH
jgi:hypothetical protein